jgi:hypothetical protein
MIIYFYGLCPVRMSGESSLNQGVMRLPPGDTLDKALLGNLPWTDRELRAFVYQVV